MLANPRRGQRVRIWYRTTPRRRSGRALADLMPHHGATGTIEIVGRGKPRNHGVRLDSGELIVLPCGNLRKAPASADR